MQILGITCDYHDPVFKYNGINLNTASKPILLDCANAINKNEGVIVICTEKRDTRNKLWREIASFLNSKDITGIDMLTKNSSGVYEYEGILLSAALVPSLEAIVDKIGTLYHHHIHTTRCCKVSYLLEGIKNYLIWKSIDSSDMLAGFVHNPGYSTYGVVYNINSDGFTTQKRTLLKKLSKIEIDVLIKWLNDYYRTGIETNNNIDLTTKVRTVTAVLDTSVVPLNCLQKCGIAGCTNVALNGSYYCCSRHNKCVVVASHLQLFEQAQNTCGMILGRQLLYALISRYNLPEKERKKQNTLQPKGHIVGIPPCETLLDVYNMHYPLIDMYFAAMEANLNGNTTKIDDIRIRATRLAKMVTVLCQRVIMMDGHGRFLLQFLHEVIRLHGKERLNKLRITLIDFDSEVTKWHKSVYMCPKIDSIENDIFRYDMISWRTTLLYLNFCGLGKSYETVLKFVESTSWPLMISFSGMRAAKERKQDFKTVDNLGRLEKELVCTRPDGFVTYVLIFRNACVKGYFDHNEIVNASEKRKKKTKALIVQCMYRTYIARNRMKMLKRVQAKAILLKATLNLKFRAVLKLQSVYRGYRARLKVKIHIRKIAKLEIFAATLELRNLMALKIQCSYRVHFACKTMKSLIARIVKVEVLKETSVSITPLAIAPPCISDVRTVPPSPAHQSTNGLNSDTDEVHRHHSRSSRNTVSPMNNGIYSIGRDNIIGTPLISMPTIADDITSVSSSSSSSNMISKRLSFEDSDAEFESDPDLDPEPKSESV